MGSDIIRKSRVTRGPAPQLHLNIFIKTCYWYPAPLGSEVLSTAVTTYVSFLTQKYKMIIAPL